MRFGKCMGTSLGGRLYDVWEVYGHPMGVIGGHLYEVWEVYGVPSEDMWGPGLFQVSSGEL